MRLTLAFLSIVCLLSSSAQNIVTFQVDMNEYVGSFNNVNLNGTLNNWCGSCATMTDANNDGIYTIDVDIANGDYEYKFTIDGFTEQETFTPGAPCTLTTGDFTNRFITIDGSTTVSAVCWESCGACGAAPLTADVTFRVDMNDYTGSAFTTVNLNGVFNGWCGGCAPMSDDDNDGVYEITANVPVGAIEYKFTADGWNFEEIFAEGTPCTTTIDGFTNRTLDVEEAATLPIVCWNACEACGALGVGEFETLDMSISPNPSNGIIQLSIAPELQNGMVNVMTLDGKLISSQAVSSIQESLLDLSNLSNGLYIVLVQSEQYQSTQRLSIQK
jgi:hypothetical protein